MANKVTYVVAKDRVVFHSKEERFYYEDEPIDLPHLNASEVAAVLSTGAIVEAKPKKEVKHGESNLN